jgi:hypothetical protein
VTRRWLARACWYFALAWVISLGLAILAGMVYVSGWRTVAVLMSLVTFTWLALVRIVEGRPS